MYLGSFETAYHLGRPSGKEADRSLQAMQVARFGALVGIENTFSSEQSRAGFIDALTLDAFESHLTRINGIAMNTPIRDRGYAAGLQCIVDMEKGIDAVGQHIVHPEPEDKKELLGTVLSSAKRTADLELKASILAIGINAVHPFADGNGRTARLVYHAVAHGADDLKKTAIQLFNDSEELLSAPNPDILRTPVISEMGLSLKTHTYNQFTRRAEPSVEAELVWKRGLMSVILRDSDRADTLYRVADADMSTIMSALLLHTLLSTGKEHRAERFFNIKPNGKAALDVYKFAAGANSEEMKLVQEAFGQLSNMYVKQLVETIEKNNHGVPIYIPDGAGNFIPVSFQDMAKGLAGSKPPLDRQTYIANLQQAVVH